jgi:hypothetical protein
MAIRIAINGFGRIGRNVLRCAKQAGRTDLDFVAVNDLTDSKTLAHLLKYDSVHGRYEGTVEVFEDGLRVDGDDLKSRPPGSSGPGSRLPNTWTPEPGRSSSRRRARTRTSRWCWASTRACTIRRATT